MKWMPRARSGASMGWEDPVLEWVERDGWQVVRSFGDEAAERLALEEAVGLADTSAVGKLLVQGRDRERVLEELAEPRSRDAHPIASWRRPAGAWAARWNRDEHYVVTPLAELPAVQAELERRLRELGHAHVTPITHARDVITLCGPRAAAALAKLCSLDLSDRAFPADTARFAALAHISAFVARTDHAGRPRFDLHVDRSYGEYLWDTLLDAAREHGGRPVGLGALEPASVRAIRRAEPAIA